MSVSGQFRAPVSLRPWKEPLVRTRCLRGRTDSTACLKAVANTPLRMPEIRFWPFSRKRKPYTDTAVPRRTISSARLQFNKLFLLEI